jgi:hypothetical protein
MRRRVRTIAGVGAAIVLVVAFGASRLLGGMDGLSSGPASTCEDPVAWDEAAEVVGEHAAVEGPVTAASFEPDVGGGPTFLNLGAAHPETPRFDVVIYEDLRDGFDGPPEEVFEGVRVCAQGRVDERDGVPQIVLDAPGLLERR